MRLTELIVKLSIPSDHAASVNEEINAAVANGSSRTRELIARDFRGPSDTFPPDHLAAITL